MVYSYMNIKPIFIISNLTIWAGLEMFGCADVVSYLNPKHKIRNPKQYLMIQIQMIKTRP